MLVFAGVGGGGAAAAARLPLPLLVLLVVPCRLVLGGVQIDGALSEAEVLQAEQLIRYVSEEGDPEYVDQSRNFGTDQEHEGGHQVTFLHAHAKLRFPTLLRRLWQVAKSADSKAGWGAAQAVGSERLGLRCMESINYSAAGVGKNSSAASLGWHHDGHTLITVAVMLSSAEDYEGGNLEVRQKQAHAGPEEVVTFAPDRGDAVAWRGWDFHRVGAVRKGLRHVLVAEFWSGPDVAPHENRPQDFEDGYRIAIALDPSAAILHKNLAWMVFERGDLSLAFEAISGAIRSGPDVESWVLLGRLHHNRNELQEAKEAYDEALKLNPNDPVALIAFAEHARETGGNIVDIESCYHRAVDAGGWQALEALGDMRSSEGRHHEAAEHYRKSLSFDPGDDFVEEKLQQSLERAHSASASSWWSKLKSMLTR